MQSLFMCKSRCFTAKNRINTIIVDCDFYTMILEIVKIQYPFTM